MKCEDPKLCYIKEDTRIFVPFSKASPILRQCHNYVFNCDQCLPCRKRRAQELAVRCVLHASMYDHNSFLTLTYDEKRPDYHNEFQYSDIQKFKKRLRNEARVSYCDISTRKRKYYYFKKIQIFNVHEYGKRGKKHWHLVVFNHNFEDRRLFTVKSSNRLYTSDKLTELWGHGHCTIGSITEASALYTAQYTQKDLANGNLNNRKKAHSKHAGIGRPYFLKHYSQILRLGFIPFNGKKFPIPRYFLKIAHKHYSHFYENQNFFDTPQRKKLYTPFKDGQAIKLMADLYKVFRAERDILLDTLRAEWEEHIKDYVFGKEEPDFKIAADNYRYDRGNKINHCNF